MIMGCYSVSALGDGVSVDQKDYYCVDVELPDARTGATRELFMLDTAATSSLLTPKAAARLGTVLAHSSWCLQQKWVNILRGPQTNHRGLE